MPHKLQTRAGSIVVACVVMLFCLYVTFVPVTDATDDVNGYSESDSKYKQHNGLSGQTAQQSTTKEQIRTGCKDCDDDLVNGKHKMESEAVGDRFSNGGYLERLEALQQGHTTTTPLTVNTGDFVTAKKSKSGQREKLHLEDTRARRNVMTQIRTLHKRLKHETTQPSHMHETTQTSHMHETNQPSHTQDMSLSYGTILTLTTEEKLERLSKVRRVRRYINSEDLPESESRIRPKTPVNSESEDERAKKTHTIKPPSFRRETRKSFNEQTPKSLLTRPAESLPLKNPKPHRQDENNLPFIQRITINVLPSGTDGGGNKSLPSATKSTQLKGQRNVGETRFRISFLKSNRPRSTVGTTERAEYGKTISEDKGGTTPKGSRRKGSNGDHGIDDSLVSDGATDDSGSFSDWSSHHAGISRDDVRENRLVRPLAADRLEQRISPGLDRSYQELMDLLHGTLQTLLQSLQRVNSYNKEIFNVTRYDIMMGAREISKKLNEANDLIYDGVVSATQFAREVMLKYQSKQDAKGGGRLQEQQVRPLDSQVVQRNFQPQLDRTSEEQRSVQEKIKNINSLKMKCVQGESRLKQVRELFYSNYDRSLLGDLYGFLNTSINQLNTGLRMSPKLRELKRFKFYLDYIKNVIAEARNTTNNSAEEIRKGRKQVQANYVLYNKWLQEEHTSRQFRGSHRGVRLNIPSQLYVQQQALTSQAKEHVSKLKSQQTYVHSLLDSPMKAAKTFLARNNKNVTQRGFQDLTSHLQLLMKNMYSSLDLLQVFIGSKAKIKAKKKCKSQTEGSGMTDNGDDEDLCEEEGSGYEQFNDEKVFAANDEDFTFDGEPKDAVLPPVNSMKQLALDLTDFTSRLVGRSQKIHDQARSLQQSLAGLQPLWSTMESSVSDFEKSADLQKDFVLNFENRSRDFKEMKLKIQDISHKLDHLKSFKLDESVKKAKQVIENANKRPGADGRRHPSKILPEEKSNKTTDGTGRDKNVGYDFNYSDLLKQGKKILVNHADLKVVQSMAVENCERIGNHFTYIRKNMSLLRQKVEKARQMLTTMQLSMSKSGSGHITSPIPQAHPGPAASLTTSIKACVKPRSLDGTLLLVTGNNSASYSVTVDDGKLAVNAYNNKHEGIGSVTIDQILSTEQWYTLDIQRSGETLFVTVSQAGDKHAKSKVINNLELLQPLPLMAYIGGVPPHLGISGASWEGCVGELTVNGRAVTLFSSSSEGTKPSLCTDHCISDVHKPSVVFSGNGFAHFIRPETERIGSITLKFSTHQEMASLLSVTNRNHRFYLSVVVAQGALKIESSSPNENVVLLSLNSSLNDGLGHSLRVVYRGSRTYPELDGNREAFSVERAPPQILTEALPGVLLGALVSKTRQFMNTLYRPFIGCLHDITINDERLLLPDAADVYNTFYGDCIASRNDIWQSCWQWTEHSKPLSLGVVENSNRISLLVSSDAEGPLIRFTKEDKFDIEVTMTKTGIDVRSDDSEGVLARPEKDSSNFVLVVIVDEGNNVRVQAWEQKVNFNYGGLWGYFSKDLTKPHTVVIGGARGGDDRMFAGSVSQFAIEDRFNDLSPYSSSLNLSSCKRPPEEIAQTEEEIFSCA